MRTKLARIAGHTFLEGPVSEESVVLDLGANRGHFALEVQRRWGCQVHAVEPTPGLASVLRQTGRLTVYEAAVSSENKDLFFKVDSHNSESSAVSSGVGEAVIRVAGLTLDDLLRGIGRVDLLKVDVEGSEVDVLMTVSEDLVTQIPQITVEFHDFKVGAGVSREMVVQVFRRMKALDFGVGVMSYWTNGDVLFLNRRFFSLGLFDRMVIQLKGRWLPGVKRVLGRVLHVGDRPGLPR